MNKIEIAIKFLQGNAIKSNEGYIYKCEDGKLLKRRSLLSEAPENTRLSHILLSIIEEHKKWSIYEEENE